jgi:acyl-CoA thioesterase-1
MGTGYRRRFAVLILCAALPWALVGAAETTRLAAESPGTVLFFGNSITAGLGVRPDASFPALIQRRIDAERLPFKVINAGLSGETSAGGLRRIDWLLQQRVDLLVIELGANDGLRGISLMATRKNLQGIIDRARAAHPRAHIVLAGMQIPPNLGPEYTSVFRSLFPELAKANSTLLIPFLLQGVGGIEALNLADGIHPNPEGHRRVAQNAWEILAPVLRGIGASGAATLEK